MHLLKSFALLLVLATTTFAILGKKNGHYVRLPTLREQVNLQDEWTQSRIDAIPELLQKHSVDSWLMSQREYAEDTVFWSLKRAKQFSARRRTLSLYLAKTKSASSPKAYTWIDNTPAVWDELRSVLAEENVRSIALNIDTEISFSSGLHAGEYEKIKKELVKEGGKFEIVNDPMLAVSFVGTMPEIQLDWWKKLQGTAWAMISEAFSEKVITPGVTSTDDVEWWLRDKIQEQNYTTWFHPDVEVVRPGPWSPNPSSIIQYGDMLHVDFGVTALGMNTDTQHLAYVLFPGEAEEHIPPGLLDGLKTVNRLQDIVKENMEVGKTGNDILEAALRQMEREEIKGKIYCHAIGDWGHSAGTVIGMTNLQSGVPGLGELPLINHTYYSVELYAEHFVPEYNATMNFYQEEDVYWDGVDEQGKDVWTWGWGRQEEFHLIRTKGAEGVHEGGLTIQDGNLRLEKVPRRR